MTEKCKSSEQEMEERIEPGSAQSLGQANQAETIRRKPSIAELEAMLAHDDEVALTILPNGEVVMDATGIDVGDRKPITFRENLGGEYGCCEFEDDFVVAPI